MWGRMLGLAWLSMSAACGSRESAPAAPPAPGLGVPPVGDAELDADWPQPRVIGSADGEVADLGRLIGLGLAKGELSAVDGETLVGLVLTRFALAGAPADLALALAQAAAIRDRWPDEAAARRASFRALLAAHRFTEAEAELTWLRSHSTHPSEWEALAASFDAARGELATAIEIRARIATVSPRAEHLANWALVLAEHGEFAEAEAKLRATLAAMRGPSPSQVAFVWFQAGLLAEEQQALARAEARYQRAYDLCPYSLETVTHLAPLRARRDRAGAEQAVRRALERNDHPELWATLAAILEAGPARDQAIARADAGWQAVLTTAPEAYRDHAARFYLGPGADPARALAYADANARARTTVAAQLLLLEAIRAAPTLPEAATRACAVARTLAPRLRPDQRRALFATWQALTACGDPSAATLGQTLGIPTP